MASMKYGEWLKAKRGRRGSPGFLSQQRLAELAGIDRTYLNRIERGFIQLPEDELRGRIHKALGTNDEDLRAAGVNIDNNYGRLVDISRMVIEPDETPSRPAPRTEQEQWDEELLVEEIMIGIYQISDSGRSLLLAQLNLIREYFPYLPPEENGLG